MAFSDTSSNALAVTPSDSTGIPLTFGLYIGGAGNIKVDTRLSTGVTFTAVPTGTILPVQVQKVYATGTTATNIIALY